MIIIYMHHIHIYGGIYIYIWWHIPYIRQYIYIYMVVYTYIYIYAVAYNIYTVVYIHIYIYAVAYTIYMVVYMHIYGSIYTYMVHQYGLLSRASVSELGRGWRVHTCACVCVRNHKSCNDTSHGRLGTVILVNKAFRLVVRSSFVFASSNCDWLRLMTSLISPNHSYCFQKQIKIKHKFSTCRNALQTTFQNYSDHHSKSYPRKYRRNCVSLT